MIENSDILEKDLEALCKKHGLEDWFFIGVDVMFDSARIIAVGTNESNTSNLTRAERLVGAINQGVFKIQSTMEFEKDDEDRTT